MYYVLILVQHYDDMLSRFHLIPERHGQTDRQTYRIAISISRVSILTRDKNWFNVILYIVGGPILMKFGSLAQNDMPITVILSKLKPDV